MKRRAVLFAAMPAMAQLPPGYPQTADPLGRDREKDVKLPNGKSQKDEILKDDHKKNVADAGELAKLTADLRDEIEKSAHNVLSLGLLKKLDDAEKLVKKIRGRMKRY
ncbi:hypothetical protein F183_A20140 [Bryobacterales bacterium F-183]|nr:hypothetical protein F183_A20140 [Bryobacterales bacterium F-183]